MSRKVKVTVFRASGKFYSEEVVYVKDDVPAFQIYDHFRWQQSQGRVAGLTFAEPGGAREYVLLVEPDYYPPALINVRRATLLDLTNEPVKFAPDIAAPQ